MRNKSFRVHQENKRKLSTQIWLKRYRDKENVDEHLVGIYSHSPARCSCDACGNQRKISGDKISETRQKMREKDFE